jgi:hypothetical protein
MQSAVIASSPAAMRWATASRERAADGSAAPLRNCLMAPPPARKDAVDLIFALTSYPTFASLSAGRSRDEVSRLVQAACRAALAPLINPSS